MHSHQDVLAVTELAQDQGQVLVAVDRVPEGHAAKRRAAQHEIGLGYVGVTQHDDVRIAQTGTVQVNAVQPNAVRFRAYRPGAVRSGTLRRIL
ncbi:hypothetical protein GCM10009603_26520 [Nocardiopsis exhalans]